MPSRAERELARDLARIAAFESGKLEKPRPKPKPKSKAKSKSKAKVGKKAWLARAEEAGDGKGGWNFDDALDPDIAKLLQVADEIGVDGDVPPASTAAAAPASAPAGMEEPSPPSRGGAPPPRYRDEQPVAASSHRRARSPPLYDTRRGPPPPRDDDRSFARRDDRDPPPLRERSREREALWRSRDGGGSGRAPEWREAPASRAAPHGRAVPLRDHLAPHHGREPMLRRDSDRMPPRGYERAARRAPTPPMRGAPPREELQRARARPPPRPLSPRGGGGRGGGGNSLAAREPPLYRDERERREQPLPIRSAREPLPRDNARDVRGVRDAWDAPRDAPRNARDARDARDGHRDGPRDARDARDARDVRDAWRGGAPRGGGPARAVTAPPPPRGHWGGAGGPQKQPARQQQRESSHLPPQPPRDDRDGHRREYLDFPKCMTVYFTNLMILLYYSNMTRVPRARARTASAVEPVP